MPDEIVYTHTPVVLDCERSLLSAGLLAVYGSFAPDYIPHWLASKIMPQTLSYYELRVQNNEMLLMIIFYVLASKIMPQTLSYYAPDHVGPKIFVIFRIGLQYTISIIMSQLHCFQLRTTLNGKDFKFFSHGLCTEKQNIHLQHMHEK